VGVRTAATDRCAATEEEPMLRPFAPTALAIATLASGCIVYETPASVGPGPVTYINYSPEILDADAGCYFDRRFRDDVWLFEAVVDDGNGPLDVVAVWADVWDDFDGTLVESFELFPTNDPYLWYSDWLGSTTWLMCGYGYYSVDIVAYDTFEAVDAITILPWID